MSETLDSNWRPKGNNSFTSIENVFQECRVAVVSNYYTRSSQSPYLRHIDFKCSCMQEFKMVSLNTTQHRKTNAWQYSLRHCTSMI